ncbi:5-carboxymethyl-2-hydroxymuconate isomerase [Virgibacillus profundi]|uniref:5-carboxymethyl-2-hydroxymuconate isomerase n=1 Tax=Virgibacillus profundi TaxID=2024555 RepID=A0A2A2IC82_9BACI|nr:5-carboxymethyl-2-hydroxymuconate Delta-isomerase [Virgibacillus profundi]PAV28884.1 5-carboxymethyl-2-hydroxymuconate isomerase [Virgibacillus profundi]PXY53052.1 5-carboxymethyl-2-hydroxymuconate isomerase [Virgibacillus profundi]
MPHFYIEYTNNLKTEADIPQLLQTVNEVFRSHNHIIPVAGLRIRAIELTDYLIADGSADDAFVHATLKLGKGRSEKDKKNLSDDLFKRMENHFADLFVKRYLALSMEVYEFSNPTYKKNNIHTRFES